MIKIEEENVKKYQLEILDVVNQFCFDNNIKYFLGFGTLIGAIRHNGFIPWDDDIDILMFRDDYEKFIDMFNSNIKGYHAYSCEKDKCFNLSFCKIAKDNTLEIDNNLKINSKEIGINIDLFPIDKYPENYDGGKLYKQIELLEQIVYCKAFKLKMLGNKSVKQKIKILSVKVITCMINKHSLAKLRVKLMKQFYGDNTDKCTVIINEFKGSFSIWNIDDFVPIKHEFENKEYIIPLGYDNILTEEYGNYMVLPPIDKRISFHNFVAYKEEESV